LSFPLQITNLAFFSFLDERIQRNVDRTNTIFGALDPRVRNVYSTHGQLDPWRPMGVQEDINEFSPTVILPLESHCSDLYSLRDSDTPEMRDSKLRIFELVQEWTGIFISSEEEGSGSEEESVEEGSESVEDISAED